MYMYTYIDTYAYTYTNVYTCAYVKIGGRRGTGVRLAHSGSGAGRALAGLRRRLPGGHANRRIPDGVNQMCE